MRFSLREKSTEKTVPSVCASKNERNYVFSEEKHELSSAWHGLCAERCQCTTRIYTAAAYMLLLTTNDVIIRLIHMLHACCPLPMQLIANSSVRMHSYLNDVQIYSENFSEREIDMRLSCQLAPAQTQIHVQFFTWMHSKCGSTLALIVRMHYE